MPYDPFECLRGLQCGRMWDTLLVIRSFLRLSSRILNWAVENATANPDERGLASPGYAGVPARLVGWAEFMLDLGGPVLALFLALVATTVAIASGDLSPAALVGATALGGGASVGLTRLRIRRKSHAVYLQLRNRA